MDSNQDLNKIDSEFPDSFMLKINGTVFKCECGCNVFLKADIQKKVDANVVFYQCCGCENLYEGVHSKKI